MSRNQTVAEKCKYVFYDSWCRLVKFGPRASNAEICVKCILHRISGIQSAAVCLIHKCANKCAK